MKHGSSMVIRVNMWCWHVGMEISGIWAAVNAGKEPLKLKLDLEMFAGKTVALYKDDKKGEPQLTSLKVKENGKVQLEIRSQGGAVLVAR